ncbi:MAG: hypothetical protein IKB50_01360 [Clostridia bacterium]|nr:hypothetical protein [Clostridia bacterium]
MDLSLYKEVIYDSPYIYCRDENHRYIIDANKEKILFSFPLSNGENSVISFCGETPLGPSFYDSWYSTYIHPTDKGYKIHPHILRMPICVNGDNLINITEDDTGLMIIKSSGEVFNSNHFDSISAKICITGNINGKTEEIKIPFFQCGKGE